MKKDDAVYKELHLLKTQLKAFKIQNRIFDLLFDITSSACPEGTMERTLQTALDTITEISGATNGSLFLFDDQGRVTDSLLARGDLSDDARNRIIGSVLDKGLAGWVRRHCKVGLIKDTHIDSRWIEIAGQPFEVRSALSIPVIRRDFLYGLLTLTHPEPDYFSGNLINTVQMISDQVAVAVENAQLYIRQHEANQQLIQANKKIEEYSDALQSELKKGRKIQKEFLPYKIPVLDGADIQAFFHPALQLSGDFYDFFLLPGNLLGIVIADVSDKGVGPALFMALVRSLIRIFSGHFDFYNSFRGEKGRVTSPIKADDILFAASLTNDYLAMEHGDEGMFATLFLGIFDPDSGKMVYTNCGHEPLYKINESGIVLKIAPLGPALGVFPGIQYPAETIHFNPGDIFLGLTDGVTEARSDCGELYSRQRLERVIAQAPLDSSDHFLSTIKNDLFEHIGDSSQSDDITLFVIQKH